MKKNRIIAAAVILALAAASPAGIYAQGAADESSAQGTEETTEPTTEEPAPVYKVTFLDFEGKKMAELDVAEGEKIDYSSIDTSVLRRHVDKYTEQEFSQWSSAPETAGCDITLKALYRKATLSIESEPTKRRYITAAGDIDTSGLKVSITVETQLPELDSSGKYKTEMKLADISASCLAKPATLEEAFSGDKTEAKIEIFPIGDTKALASYSISLVKDLGDVTRNGKIDAVDASRILRAYAELNSSEPKEPDADLMKYGDINGDGIIDATDASFVLRYYVISSAHKTPDWEEIAGIK